MKKKFILAAIPVFIFMIFGFSKFHNSDVMNFASGQCPGGGTKCATISILWGVIHFEKEVHPDYGKSGGYALPL